MGQPALDRAAVQELLQEIPDFPERACVWEEEEGYLFIELAEPWEGHEIWLLARILGGFVLEAGPDSGGPGWAGNGEASFELIPQNFPALAVALLEWKAKTPPAGSGALEKFLALLKEAA
ncbi:hypothetical protein [Thermus islandicus]|uniref:hypothetical protein n=1 Tax=Thermus islandicus TaxID=540988 RepID=UPI0003B41E1E|nr:hypothetical protein [Thermus islandicus]